LSARLPYAPVERIIDDQGKASFFVPECVFNGKAVSIKLRVDALYIDPARGVIVVCLVGAAHWRVGSVLQPPPLP
jgi:hypothetical protein